MVIYKRTFSICNGKESEAHAFLIEVVNWVNMHFPGHDAHVLVNVHGPANQLHFIGSYESLAEMEAALQRADADPNWLALAARGQGLLENADVTIYRRIS